MNKKKLLWNLLVGVLIVGALLSLFVFSDQISPTNEGPAFETERIVRSILILASAWMFTRLITLVVLDSINEKRKKVLPNIIKDIIGAIVYFIAIVLIVTEVYDQNIGNLGAFFISSWAIIGFAAKDFIADCIHGISLDLQADFELGDWIQLQDGTIGKLIEMKMMGVDVLLPNDTVLFLSNTMLNSDPMINLSKPNRDYYLGINVTLEHSVPVGRARRILLSAVAGAPMVFNHEVSVFAESVQANGVVYCIYFKCSDRSVWLETRHKVIQAITESLHKFGLRACQITGEINIRSNEHIPQILFDDSCVTDAFSALKSSLLLEGCDDEIQKQFANNMKMVMFKNGEEIVKNNDVGETMFIIAEGIVDVYLDIDFDKTREDDNETHKVACLVDGEYFGETALLMGEKRNATVVARTDTILYEINRETVKEFIEKYPEFAQKLSSAIVKRNSRNKKFENRIVEEKENSERAISEFATAFKNFLWNH